MVRAALASLALAIAIPASGVLIDGVDGAANVAPFDVPVLDNLGTRAGLSAIYLGNGVVLTAHHVGAGDVAFGGVVHPYVPGSEVRLTNQDGTHADLLMFAIHPRPDLPDLRIVSARPGYLSVLIVAGNGLDRGDPIWWDPNGTAPPGMTAGFQWGSSSRLRWGINYVELYPAGRVFNTQAFGSYFDAGLLLPEAQAVLGDSGGGVFSLVIRGYSVGWELSGVVLGISQYSGQPANTSFFGQRTYYADLAYYRPQIADAIALPEPAGAWLSGAALAFVLAAHRRRRVLD